MTLQNAVGLCNVCKNDEQVIWGRFTDRNDTRFDVCGSCASNLMTDYRPPGPGQFRPENIVTQHTSGA